MTAAPDTRPWIHLASQSPRRLQLLTQIGVRCELLLAGPDEDAEALEAVHGDEAPGAYVARVTRLKAQAALQRWQRRGLVAAPILCADTTVACAGRILGKPADAAAAHAMLRHLAGREHEVLTAVAVATPDGAVVRHRVQTSRVRFAPLSDADIVRYVATGEPMGKAGAYAIQGAAAAWISHIEGSHSAIMGLPLFETAALLREAGLPF